MGPRSMGIGGVTTGAQFAERIELGLFTLRRWEMFFASPTSPSGRYRLVALTPSRDLFVHAKDLFVEANDREPLLAPPSGARKALAQQTDRKASSEARESSS